MFRPSERPKEAVHQALLKAIEAKDLAAVKTALSQGPRLNSMYLDMAWSTRAICHFDEAIANALVAAGMVCRNPRTLCYKAVELDDVAALDWLLKDKNVLRRLARPKRNGSDLGVTDYDAMLLLPWRLQKLTPKLRRHLLEHPDVYPFLGDVAMASRVTLDECVERSDWEEAARLLRFSSKSTSFNQVTGLHPLQFLIATAISFATLPGYMELEKNLRALPDMDDVFSLLDGFVPMFPAGVARYLCRDGHPEFKDLGVVSFRAIGIQEAIFFSCPPLFLEVSKSETGRAVIAEILRDPARGPVLLACVCCAYNREQIQEFMSEWIERFPDWRDHRGRNLVQAMIAPRVSVGLVEYAAKQYPELLMEAVPGVGDGLDSLMIGKASSDSFRSIAMKIRRSLLQAKAKASSNLLMKDRLDNRRSREREIRF